MQLISLFHWRWVYIQNKSQETPFYSAVLGAISYDKTRNLYSSILDVISNTEVSNNIERKTKKSGYELIFELLLEHEQKLRNDKPDYYQHMPQLKNIESYFGFTPIRRAEVHGLGLKAKLEQLILKIEQDFIPIAKQKDHNQQKIRQRKPSSITHANPKTLSPLLNCSLYQFDQFRQSDSNDSYEGHEITYKKNK